MKDVSRRHPSYEGGRLRRIRSLYEGGPLWREFLEHWFPKAPAETGELYKERKARATYENTYAPIVDLAAGQLFVKPPELSEALPDEHARRLRDDADRSGTPLRRFVRERVVEAMNARRAYVWVQLPAADPAAPMPGNLRDQELQGRLLPYLRAIHPESVINWSRSGTRLDWLMVEENFYEQPDALLPPRQGRRWTLIDRVQIRRWEWVATEKKPDPGDEDPVQELDPVAHGYGALPVAELVFPRGTWVGGKLEDPVTAHIRSDHDLAWALYRAANALLVIYAKWKDAKPTLGQGFFMEADREDRVEYVEPGGQNTALLAEDAVRRRQAVYRAMQQLALAADPSAAQQQQSGESKAKDWQPAEIMLSSMADAVLGFVSQIQRLVLRALGVTSSEVLQGVTTAGLDGWQSQDLQEFLDAAAIATDLRQMSPTALKEISKRTARKLFGDEVDEQTVQSILDEIDSWDPANGIPTGF